MRVCVLLSTSQTVLLMANFSNQFLDYSSLFKIIKFANILDEKNSTILHIQSLCRPMCLHGNRLQINPPCSLIL